MDLPAKLRAAADVIDILSFEDEPHSDGSPDTFAFHLVEGMGQCPPTRDFRTVKPRTEAKALTGLTDDAARFLFTDPDVEVNYSDQSGLCRAMAESLEREPGPLTLERVQALYEGATGRPVPADWEDHA